MLIATLILLLFVVIFLLKGPKPPVLPW